MMIRCFLVAISLVWQVESGSDARAQLLSHTISDDIPEALFQLPLASESKSWKPHNKSNAFQTGFDRLIFTFFKKNLMKDGHHKLDLCWSLVNVMSIPVDP